MSRTIDEKVVEMRFDNKHFEANVQTSISTLEKLKNSLNLNGAAKGLENINDAARKCDMSTLGKSVETVQAKFSALEVMAMTTLSNITNSAVNAGKRLAASFTVEPIATGFNEYELKMGSIQTIMAGTGESLERVNQKLDELNLYSDKTIYSFADMTQNIGKFTNAGVKLDDAVAAIQGVANVAAVSGANANEASRAMYNFGQALSSGYVKLIDWKSIENANMATVEFKQQLMDTAVEMGTLVKVGDKFKSTTTDLNGKVSEAFNSTLLFNDSLSAQWMTTEVLSKTLAKYADENTEIGKKAFAAAQDVKTFSQMMDTLKESAQSGWAETWQLIVGDFEEAKKLFTVMSEGFGEIISDSAEARNSILRGGLSSGWDELREKVEACGVPLEDFEKKLAEVGKKHGVLTDKMIEEAGSLEGTFANGWVNGKIFSETLLSFIDTAAGFSAATDKMTGSLEELEKVAGRVINGEFGSGADRVKALTEAGYDYASVQSMVNHVLIGTELNLENMSDAQLKSVGYTEEQIKMMRALADEAKESGTSMDELLKSLTRPSPREMIIQSVANAISGLTGVLKTLRGAWQDIFPPEEASQRIYNLVSAIYDFSQKLKVTEDEMNKAGGTMDKLRRTFKGLFAVLDIFTTLTGGAFKAAVKTAAKLLGMMDVDILSVTASIGDAIVAFRDWIDQHNFLANGIEKALPYIESGIKAFRDWITSLGELPIVENAVSRFGDAFRDTSERFDSFMKGGIERINAFIKRVKAMDSLSLDNIGSVLVDFRDNVLGYFLDFGGIFDGLIQAAKDFGTDVQTAFEQITGGADKAAAGMKTAAGKAIQFMLDMKDRIFSVALEIRDKLADKIGFGEIFALGLGAAMVAFTKKISDALGLIASPFEGIGTLLKSASKALNAFAAETKSKALLNVAEAIAVLVGALAVLTFLDQEKLKGALVVLGLLAAGMMAVSFAMSKMGNPKELVKLSVSIVAVGGSLLMLANAMKTLESLNGDKVGGSLAILGTLAAGLVAVSKLLSSKDKMFSQSAVFMLGFALSLKVLVSALKDLDKLEINNLGQTMTLLLGAVASLALVAAACKNVKFGAAATVLAIVVSLKLLVGCFEDIAKIDIGKAKSSMGAFASIFGMFAALMVASKFSGENASKAGSAIMKMSASLLLITTAFKMMAGIDPLDLDRATDTVSKLLLVFAAVTAASHFAGENASKAGSMLLLMSGAILILSTTMVVLAHLDPSGLGRALGAISTLLLVFGAMVGITYFAKDSSKIQGTLVTMAIAISGMVAAIAALSLLDPERLAGATVAITSLVGMFALLVASTHFAKKAGGLLVIMTGVVAGLAGILTLMSAFNVQSAISNAAALSILLTSMSASLLILSKAGTVAPTAYAAMGIMTAVVAGLAVILGIMDGLGVGASIETAASLSVLLLSMSGACVILAGVGATGPAAFVGIGALGTLIAGLGGIMAAICALTAEYPTVEEDLDRAIMVMEKIGTGLGAALGGFIGGALGGLSSGLPIIGTNLSAFMTNAQPFFKGVKGVDAEAMAGVKSLAETLLILTGVNVAEGLTSWLTGGTSLADFGEELIAFAPKFVEYSKLMEGIKPEVIDASANAAKTLAEFASAIPNQGGLLADLIGDNTLSTFAEELVPFGENFSKYAQSIDGINAETVAASANAAKSLAEFATAIPNQGGVLADLVGDNTLSSFAEELTLFGPSLKSYADSVIGLDSSVVENSANAAKSLAEMANCLPNSGGILASWMGDNTLSSFANELDRFGPAIMGYANSVTGLPVDVIDASVSAAGALAALAEGLPNQGGLAAWFSGDNTLSSFGTELISFGKNLSAYSTAIGDMKPEVVVASANAAQALSNLATGLPDSSLFDQWFGGDQTLATFGNDIAAFGASMGNYYAKVAEIDISKMNGIVAAVWKLVDLAKGAKEVDKNSFSNFKASLASLADSGLDGFLGSFTNSETKINSAILTMMGNLSASITRNKYQTDSAMKDVTSSMVNVVDQSSSALNSAGARLLSKLAATIRNNSAGVKKALSDVFSQSFSDLSNVSATFSKTKDNPISDYLALFHSSEALIKPAAISFLTSIGLALMKNQKNATSAMTKVMTSLVKCITDKKAQLTAAAKEIMLAMAETITENKKPIVAATTDVVNAAVKAVSNSRTGFVTAGAQASAGFAAGIRMNMGLAISAGSALGAAALNAAKTSLDSHSPSRKFMKLGEDSDTGYANGVLKGIPGAVAAENAFCTEMQVVVERRLCGNEMTEAVDQHFSYIGDSVEKTADRVTRNTADLVSSNLKYTQGALKEFVDTAEQYWRDGSLGGLKSEVHGLRELRDTNYSFTMGDVAEQFKSDLQVAAGVSGKIKAAQDAISGDAAAIEQTTKAMAEDAAFTGKSFLEYIEYLQKGATLEQTMLRGFTLGNYKDEKETVLKSLDGLEEQLHQKQIEDIQNKRELNQITGQEELAMYEQLLAETKAYAEERKMKGDMETYKQFAEWVMELDKTIYQKRIELKREEYEFSMDWIEQEQYYNRMGLADELAAYKRVQARYAKGTEERKKMDREIYRVEKEIYEAREQYTSDIQKVYQEANDKRIELEQEHADKVAEINEKLAADIQKEEERYQSSLESRAKSLYQTYGLFDEVKKREEVSGEKLMANLEDQVKEFGDWQDSLNSLSARGLEKELIEELSQMGPSAISQIKALNGMSDKELEKYAALWSIKHAQARDQAIVELEGLRSETLENIDKLRASADEELVKYEATWNQRMDELVKNAEKELDELRIAFGKKIGLIQNETEEDLRKMTESAQEILRGAGWSETGQLIGEGLIEGVRSKRQEFLDLMTSMASDSLSCFSKPVEINSPSRAFYRKGEYIGMGLVNGLRSYQDKTANAAGELGNTAMNGFSNALQSITACLDDNMDMEPTIRPVLDLSELTNASSRLDGLFTPQRTLHLAGQASLSFGSEGRGTGSPEVKTDSEKIVQELHSLRSEMADMTARIEKMRIVLDSGAVVGQLAGPMDAALGQKAAYRGRGI